MILVIGEILIDRFPDYERIGGAPFNFAYHLMQLGFAVKFISRIGNDADGRKIRAVLKRKQFPDQDIQVDNRNATGTVTVVLDAAGVPQFNIHDDVAYDYIDLSALHNDAAPADLIYYGTLAQRSSHAMARIQAFLEKAPSTALRFCDINLRPPHVHAGAVDASLKQADILKLNAEELSEVSRLCSGPTQPDAALQWLMHTFSISAIAVTRGDQGSSLYTTDGASHAPAAPVSRIVDTVGAGDAYAAVLAAGRLCALPDASTLELATQFAADVCALAGATPEEHRLYAGVKERMERIPHGR